MEAEEFQREVIQRLTSIETEQRIVTEFHEGRLGDVEEDVDELRIEVAVQKSKTIKVSAVSGAGVGAALLGIWEAFKALNS